MRRRPLKKISTVLIALILALGALSNANADSYTFTTLYCPGAAQGTVAFGINDAGTVVGMYEDSSSSQHGFVWSNGTYTPLNYPGGTSTFAQGINNTGTIVGNASIPAPLGNEAGYSLNGGTYTPVLFGGPMPNINAFGINDAGTIVGGYNNGGFEAGFCLLSNGTYTTINYGSVPTPTILYGINNAGTIVGDYGEGGIGNGFIWSNGTFTPLNYPGAISTTAYGINDAGTVVGTYNGGVGIGVHGFILSNGIYTSFDIPGADSGTTVLYGINDAGTIVGSYIYLNSNDVGEEFGFLATPTPIPGAILLFAPGLVGLAAIRRRFKG